jgi:hypothetical protein
MTILHLQRLGGGAHRITTEQPDSEQDVLGWVWQSDPPAGTALTLSEQQLGYTKWDLTGMSMETGAYLTPYAQNMILTDLPESYEEWLARWAQEKQRHNEYYASAVPGLGGVTFGQVFADPEKYKGLHESDGRFIWVGLDPAESTGGMVATVIEICKQPESEKLRKDIRWFVEQQGSSLWQALAQEDQLQAEILEWMVFKLASG